MEKLDAVGVGALNKDIKFEVTLEDLELINTKLDEPFVLGKEDFDKPENFEDTIDIITKVTNQEKNDLKIEVGGSAALTMISLSRMGFQTGYLSMSGYDDRFLRNGLRAEGVDPYMVFIGGLGSGACIVVSDGRDKARRVYPNSNDLLSPQFLNNAPYVLENLSNYKIIHMSSFACSLGDGPLEAQKIIAKKLGDEVTISFAHGELYANLGLEQLEPILLKTKYLFLNEKEVEKLTGKCYQDGKKKLLEYCPYVIVTLGESGESLLYKSHGEEVGEWYTSILISPEDSFKVKTKDNTGTGDYFASGFLAGVLNEENPEQCMRLGHRTAAMRLMGYEKGAYPKIAL